MTTAKKIFGRHSQKFPMTENNPNQHHLKKILANINKK